MNEKLRLRRNPTLWTGVVVTLLGVAFNLGWLFVPPFVWWRAPELIPMPEALIGWWIVLLGLSTIGYAVARHGRRR
ncbi:hypothetical protein [Cryptosporangium aurantiacum]|uniref:Uncharacterized protein n=1 Tax=Cryptosporangium aurantiacum TaxID=134849 RepID=A0A1M7RAL8_9ACTN|nr:hypothetical protein [Cryptosporangium aurantiacum]SHN43303.1 hypothetical protein SAMN05443668_109109 [Cryptosporangium aurantiacum]